MQLRVKPGRVVGLIDAEWLKHRTSIGELLFWYFAVK